MISTQITYTRNDLTKDYMHFLPAFLTCIYLQDFMGELIQTGHDHQTLTGHDMCACTIYLAHYTQECNMLHSYSMLPLATNRRDFVQHS